MKKCAILSMDCLDDFESYDHLIEQPMAELGWQTKEISWRAKDVNWDDFDAVVIRTPWDYQEDAEAFLKVLADIDESSAHLENSLAIAKWNIDKAYLKQIEEKGVAIVPTIWHQRLGNTTLSAADISQYFQQLGEQQIVIKPRISANADNTFWLNKANVEGKLAEINLAFESRDYMVQPFISAVIEEGEYSLFYFNGHYSHAILKTPKSGDFRVQEEHGGQLKTVEPESSLIKAAEQTMAALKSIHETPLYARVDFVRHQRGFALMEAELIEPSLYFNMDEASASRFANAFVERMNHLAL